MHPLGLLRRAGVSNAALALLRIYLHAIEALQEDAAARIEALLGSAVADALEKPQVPSKLAESVPRSATGAQKRSSNEAFLYSQRESNLHSGVPGSPDPYRCVLFCKAFSPPKFPTDTDRSRPFPAAPLENVRNSAPSGADSQ